MYVDKGTGPEICYAIGEDFGKIQQVDHKVHETANVMQPARNYF